MDSLELSCPTQERVFLLLNFVCRSLFPSSDSYEFEKTASSRGGGLQVKRLLSILFCSKVKSRYVQLTSLTDDVSLYDCRKSWIPLLMARQILNPNKLSMSN